MANLFPLLSYLDAQWAQRALSLSLFCNTAPASQGKKEIQLTFFPLSSLRRMMQHPEANNGLASPQHNMAAAAAAADPDSDAEDDPGQLLNLWLGELNTLKKVS